MAKKTPVPDLNEPAPEAPLAAGMISDGKMDATISVPDAVAGLPPADSVTTAPDGTLIVTEVEVESSDATIGIDMGASEGDQTVFRINSDGSATFSGTLSLGRKILAAGEHTIAAVGQWPTRIEHALALPLADELDTLHEVEGLVIASFMDVGDVVRKVYLNVLGHFVKA